MGKVIISSKKGIFFTLIAITVITVFIMFFTPRANISLEKDTQSVATRINTVNNYIDDLDTRYFETVLRASTYKTLLSLIFYMNSTGQYLTNVEAAYQEVIMNATINNVPIDLITGKNIMLNNTLIDWNDRMIETAKDTLRVDTTIHLGEVFISQSGPWRVDARLFINYTVHSDVADWTRNRTIRTSVSFSGLRDPAYLLNSNGLYSHRFKTSSVDFNEWNLSQVREHLRNGTYVYWQNTDAPSFLSRFTNSSIGSDCCGIESLVRPGNLTPSDQIESYVDYLLWSHKYLNDCTQLYNVTGLWDSFNYFKMDFDHISKYNITSEYVKKTC